MLIDTDVLVWMTRGHIGAAQRLSQLLPWKLSVVTYIELAQGCRTKVELNRLKKGAGPKRGADYSADTRYFCAGYGFD
jgi:predicted nucleic acid-binding protein